MNLRHVLEIGSGPAQDEAMHNMTIHELEQALEMMETPEFEKHYKLKGKLEAILRHAVHRSMLEQIRQQKILWLISIAIGLAGLIVSLLK